MTSRSKAKGGSWEREVANFLKDLYDAPFIRVPNSGAFTGGSNSSRKSFMSEGQIRHMKGDIVPPDDWIHFNCECKNYGNFPFHHLLLEKEIPLLESWLEQIKDAADEGDNNILFMKITRVGKFVGYDAKLPFKANRFVTYKDRDGDEWIITGFDSFFKINKTLFESLHKK